MSAAAQTRIFGMRVGLDPKLLVLGLVIVAGVLFWYNSRDDEEGTTHAPAAQTAQPAMTATTRAHPTRVRRSNQTNEHATLRVRPIDAASGDVDPTLRLGLLSRLQAVVEKVDSASPKSAIALSPSSSRTTGNMFAAAASLCRHNQSRL